MACLAEFCTEQQEKYRCTSKRQLGCCLSSPETFHKAMLSCFKAHNYNTSRLQQMQWYSSCGFFCYMLAPHKYVCNAQFLHTKPKKGKKTAISVIAGGFIPVQLGCQYFLAGESRWTVQLGHATCQRTETPLHRHRLIFSSAQMYLLASIDLVCSSALGQLLNLTL